jgi:predicted transcriptional regulator
MSQTISKAKSLILRIEAKTRKQSPHKISNDEPVIVQKEKDDKLYKSKLMICIDILCSLVAEGPMKFVRLWDKVELDTVHLIPHLRLLFDRGLIEQQNFGEDATFYAVTERGMKVLKVISPIIKEAHKLQIRDFEIMENKLSETGYF